MSTFNTVIVSDVHLGADISRAAQLLSTLRGISFERLILLGDIFEDLNFRRLRKSHWDVLSHVRDLTGADTGIEVVWVEGNHDEGLSKVTSHFIGVPIFQEYSWVLNGKTYLAIHGHQFDTFIVDHAFLSEVAGGFHRILQKIDLKERQISRLAKRMTKKWLRRSDAVAHKAVNYARERGADFVFCGHTHLPMHAVSGTVEYFNSGCWTDIPSTFIGITDESVEIIECE